MLAGILRHFLSLDTPLAAAATSSEGGGEGEGGVEMSSPLKLRMSKLEEYIEQLPRNLEDRKKLVEHGYSNSLWEKVSESAISCDLLDSGSLISGSVAVCEDGWLPQSGGELETELARLLH